LRKTEILTGKRQGYRKYCRCWSICYDIISEFELCFIPEPVHCWSRDQRIPN